MAGRTKFGIRRLKCSLGLIVPSKDRHSRDLPKPKVSFWQNKVRALFREWFGGASPGPERYIREMDRLGDFGMGSGEPILEVTPHVIAHCAAKVFRRRRADVRPLAEEMGRELDQRAVGWFENIDYCEKQVAE